MVLCWYCPPKARKQDCAAASLLDIPTAAEFLGLTVWQMRGLLANGELRCVRVGRKIYLRRATLIRWEENAEERYKVA